MKRRKQNKTAHTKKNCSHVWFEYCHNCTISLLELHFGWTEWTLRLICMVYLIDSRALPTSGNWPLCWSLLWRRISFFYTNRILDELLVLLKYKANQHLFLKTLVLCDKGGIYVHRIPQIQARSKIKTEYGCLVYGWPEFLMNRTHVCYAIYLLETAREYDMNEWFIEYGFKDNKI